MKRRLKADFMFLWSSFTSRFYEDSLNFRDNLNFGYPKKFNETEEQQKSVFFVCVCARIQDMHVHKFKHSRLFACAKRKINIFSLA